jgi:hypothetical protein
LIGYALGACVVLLLVGCSREAGRVATGVSSSEKQPSSHFIDIVDSHLPLTYVVWGWVGQERAAELRLRPEDAEYIWEGWHAGQGQRGFAKVLQHIRGLPDHSVLVLNYPAMEIAGMEGLQWEDCPFAEEADRLQKAVLDGDHTLLFIRYRDKPIWEDVRFVPPMRPVANPQWPFIHVFDIVPGDVARVGFAKASRALLAAHGAGKRENLSQWSIDDARLDHMYRLGQLKYEWSVDALDIGPKGRLVVVGLRGIQGGLAEQVLIDTVLKKELATVNVASPEVVFSEDGSVVRIATTPGGLAEEETALLNRTGGRVDRWPDALPAQRPASRLSVSYSSKIMDKPMGLTWHDADGNELFHARMAVSGQNYAVTSDNHYFAAADSEGYIVVWRTDDGEMVCCYGVPSGKALLTYDEAANRFIVVEGATADKAAVYVLEPP